MSESPASAAPEASLLSLLKPYKLLVGLLVALTVVGNGINLVLPQLISRAIDAYTAGTLDLVRVSAEFALASAGIFVFAYLQSVAQTFASERVARDLRQELAAKISTKEYAYIETLTPAKLLTNITSDIDSVKLFISQAIASLISSVFIIIGASTLMLLLNWKLALAVMLIIPIIMGTFFFVMTKVRKLFLSSREAIDWLNSVINESILGAALIRLVNSQHLEYQKFLKASTKAKEIGMGILTYFAFMIPFITFVANIATLVILVIGGRFIISGSMTLGEFTAFNSYLAILIFPIIVIGFMSNVIAQATASYGRVRAVLDSPVRPKTGTRTTSLTGAVEAYDLSISYGEKNVLTHVSCVAKPGAKTAIIGPTAAGKTQLLYALVGLVKPSTGEVRFDGIPLEEFDQADLHRQIGFVFQDSILFNLSLRENIAFSNTVKDEALEKAIQTAELGDFIRSLPEGLETVVSERGTSLSGGQKQRIMLARALALDPKVLILDDFTARVDQSTERKILSNIEKNYPHLTLISVTQKIAPIEHYDQILLLMEGEVLARGTHDELMRTCPEYVQIFNSQKSTSNYELQA